MKYYVYIHFNKTNNLPFYVGKGSKDRATQLTKRNHKWKAIVDNYGFYSKIIKFFENERDAFDYEKLMIKKLKKRYMLTNIDDGGSGGVSYKHTDEAKKKISNFLKTREVLVETRKKISKSLTNSTFSRKRKIKKSNSSIPVLCLNNNVVYESAHDAARKLNLSFGNICSVCRGNRPHTKNYKFVYLKKEQKLPKTKGQLKIFITKVINNFLKQNKNFKKRDIYDLTGIILDKLEETKFIDFYK